VKDKVIINVSTGNYIVGQERLRSTLSGYYDGDILFFTEESQINSPIHKENPYAFKTYAFQHALNLGYKKILWLDASIYAIKDITPVWDMIEKDGYIMQEAGWNCGQWSNDKSLEYFCLTREDAMKMPMYGNAGLLGLDFERPISQIFFERWHKASVDGIFKGAWNNNAKTESDDIRCLGHRHDMSVGSIIANLLDMSYIKSSEIMQYGSAPFESALNDTICLKAYGIS
jgi:hypothetical protein